MAAETLSKSKDHSFLQFVIVATLTIVGMTLCVLSPCILLVGLMSLGLRGEILGYLAYAAFWSIFIVVVILATAIDWLKKKKKMG